MAITRLPRNIGIDLLRVFSIMMVVVGHAGAFPNAELLTIWRMPLFFMLSGFFFTPGRSLATEFTRRWATLLIPYLAWSVVISVWLILVTWGQDEVILEHLQSGWSGGSEQSIFWMAAWFITTLAGATLLRRFLECFAPAVAWIVAIAGVATSQFCSRLVSEGIVEIHPLVDTPLRLGVSWPLLFYLLVGVLLRAVLLLLVRKYSFRPLVAIGRRLGVVASLVTCSTDVRAPYIQTGGFGTVISSPLIA